MDHAKLLANLPLLLSIWITSSTSTSTLENWLAVSNCMLSQSRQESYLKNKDQDVINSIYGYLIDKPPSENSQVGQQGSRSSREVETRGLLRWAMFPHQRSLPYLVVHTCREERVPSSDRLLSHLECLFMSGPSSKQAEGSPSTVFLQAYLACVFWMQVRQKQINLLIII